MFQHVTLWFTIIHIITYLGWELSLCAWKRVRNQGKVRASHYYMTN